MGPSVKPRRATEALASLPPLEPLPTAAERAAGAIRESIFEGRFLPGTALPETSLAQALRVSRNTVREAFRTLMTEHLLTYEAHKGVAVRRLSPDDVRDIYRVRRIHELSAIDLLRSGAATIDGSLLQESIAQAQRAADGGDWVAAGTADLRFHSRLVAVHGSRRIDEFFLRLMTEIRLGFLAITDPHAFHAPYLALNQEIYEDLRSGRHDRASETLEQYLDRARDDVLAAVTGAAR